MNGYIYINIMLFIVVLFYQSKNEKKKCRNSIYSFMRVKNEEFSLYSSLDTLYPYINRGIIGYNSNNDSSENIIHTFCSNHVQYNYTYYPYYVIPANSIEYNKNYSIRNRLDSYYNYVFNKIPKNNWILKTDGDELYNSLEIQKLTCDTQFKKVLLCMPRVNIYLINCSFHSINKNYIIDPCDQWLFYKTGEEKFVMYIKKKTQKFVAWELLKYGNKVIRHYNKVAILHISHLNRDIITKYRKNEMIDIFKLIKLNKKEILVNNRIEKHLHYLEDKCVKNLDKIIRI